MSEDDKLRAQMEANLLERGYTDVRVEWVGPQHVSAVTCPSGCSLEDRGWHFVKTAPAWTQLKLCWHHRFARQYLMSHRDAEAAGLVQPSQ